MPESHDENPCLQVLRDDFATRRAADPRVTLAVYARELGLGPSALHMILAGKRNLTLAVVQRAAVALRLSPEERDHFETLYLRSQAEDEATRAHYDRKLRGRAAAVTPARRVRRGDQRLLAQWQVPVLLVWLWDMLGSADVERLERDHAGWLARRLGLARAQLTELLDHCRRSGLTAVGADGYTHLLLDGIGRQIPQKTYLKHVLAEMLRRVDRH
jgi:uncharacterized protein (TIGR02147 family)